jgi:phospholipase/carboxylesterase
LRATIPLAHPPREELAGKPVLILSGAHDPLISTEGAARLAQTLQQDGASVTHRTLPVGHELSQADVNLARAWLQERAPADDLANG